MRPRSDQFWGPFVGVVEAIGGTGYYFIYSVRCILPPHKGDSALPVKDTLVDGLRDFQLEDLDLDKMRQEELLVETIVE